MCKVFADKIHTLNEASNNDQNKIDIETIRLYDYNISHCIGCDQCLRKPYTCPLSEKDDMPKLEELMKNADAIVIGSPSYFAGPPGILKDLMDRTRPMKMAKYQLKDKYFSVLISEGLKDGGGNIVAEALITYALIQGMIAVGTLGHPVLINNFPVSSLQMEGVKEFRKPDESIGEVGTASVEALAERLWGLLQ